MCIILGMSLIQSLSISLSCLQRYAGDMEVSAYMMYGLISCGNKPTKCITICWQHHPRINDLGHALLWFVVVRYQTSLSISYMLSHEYLVAGNRYSWLLFTSEDFAPICACKNNWWIWCHNTSTSCLHDFTDLSKKRLSLATMVKWGINVVFSRFVHLGPRIACKKWNVPVTMNNNFLSLVRIIAELLHL